MLIKNSYPTGKPKTDLKRQTKQTGKFYKQFQFHNYLIVFMRLNSLITCFWKWNNVFWMSTHI